MNRHLLTELSTSVLGIRPDFLNHLSLFLSDSKMEGAIMNIEGASVISTGDYDISSIPKDHVVIIPIVGPTFKYGYKTSSDIYVNGMDDIASLIRKIDKSSNVAGTILLFNTPGGPTQSIYQLSEALVKRKKPCYALVDGMCCSCGIYLASFCDYIYATHSMCEIGSIGVYLSIMNCAGFYESMGIKFIDVYPPESSRKNQPYREALEGNTAPIIEESLTPFALHFQEVIKANRQHIDLTSDGLLTGKVFYAQQAISTGLIDGINSIDEVAEMILTDAFNYKSIINFKKA